MSLPGTSNHIEKAQPATNFPTKNNTNTSLRDLRSPLQVHSPRLMELTERESSVMKVSELFEYAARGPVIQAFETYAHAQDTAVAGHVSLVPTDHFARTLLDRAGDMSSDLLLIPWSETGSMSEYSSPYENHSADPLANRGFVSLVARTFEQARTCHVAVFLDSRILSAAHNPQSPSGEIISPRTLERTHTGVSVSQFRRGETARIATSSGKISCCCPLRWRK